MRRYLANDYTTILQYGLAHLRKNISKLQKFQNFPARIITNTRKFDHITPVRQEVRWLPVSYCLMCTVGVLAVKCVKGLALCYLGPVVRKPINANPQLKVN